MKIFKKTHNLLTLDNATKLGNKSENSNEKPDFFIQIPIGIIYMRLSELINMIYDFGKRTSLNPWFSVNLFSYGVTYNKLIKYTFVSKDEAFIFFSLPDPTRVWLLQLTLLWTWWLTATGLQLVILIIVLISYLFPNCLYIVSPCCTMTLSVLLPTSFIPYFIRLLSLIVPSV